MPEAVTSLLRRLVEAWAGLTPLGSLEHEETVNRATTLYLACATSYWRSGSARTKPDRGRIQPRVRGRVAHAANRSQRGPSRKSDPVASPRGRSALRQAADPGELRPQPPRSIRRRHARCRLGSENCHFGSPRGCETVGPGGHLPRQRYIDNAQILKLLYPLSAQHANERNEGERFRDFRSARDSLWLRRLATVFTKMQNSPVETAILRRQDACRETTPWPLCPTQI
jgi:hypothetical protein